MTHNTDALLQQLDRMGYEVHLVTPDSKDEYARYLYHNGRSTRGRTIQNHGVIFSKLGQKNGHVVINIEGLSEDEFEYTLAHEYNHARDDFTADGFRVGQRVAVVV